MARLLVTSGLPGSGKTDFMLKLGLPDGRVFSPDRVLVRNGRYDWSPENLANAWRSEYRRFGKALQLVENSGDHIILAWDATFTSSISRCPVINMAKGAGMRVEGLFFDTPVSVCLARNSARPKDRQVPAEKIRNWAESFEEPRLHEGYDTLIHVMAENYGKILGSYRMLIRPQESAEVA
jgi:predicted kinase